MQSDIHGVSPTSGGACHRHYLPQLPLFPRSPAVREELVSAPIKGKMPILHRVSEQPQSINQPAGREKEIMFVCLPVHAFASARVAEAKTPPGVLFSRLQEPLIREDAIINVSCALFLKEERGL